MARRATAPVAAWNPWRDDTGPGSRRKRSVALRGVTPPADSPFIRIRHGMLTADALEAAGQRDGAIATLQQLVAAVPNARVQQRLDTLKAK